MTQIGMTAIIGIVAAIVFIILAVLLRRSKKRIEVDAQNYYINGLNALLDDNTEKALEQLRAAVHLDTNYIEAYIKIGDVLRQIGNSETAIKVHRDLLVRSNLSDGQRFEILKSLARDYIIHKQWKNALAVAQQILNIDSKNSWAKSQELYIFEKMGDWVSAYQTVKKSSQLSRREKAFKMAAYKMEQGRSLVASGKEHEARVRFRESIKEDSHFVSSYFELTDSYIREERSRDALDVLKKFIKSNPHFSSLAFRRLKQVLFELGQFGEIENIFIEFTKEHPDIVEAHLGLAELYEKKGEILRAIDACNRALEADSLSIETKLMLLRLNGKLGREEITSQIASDIAEQIVQQQKRFICKECGHVSDNYFYRCPSCESWNSFELKNVYFS